MIFVISFKTDINAEFECLESWIGENQGTLMAFRSISHIFHISALVNRILMIRDQCDSNCWIFDPLLVLDMGFMIAVIHGISSSDRSGIHDLCQVASGQRAQLLKRVILW